MDESSVIVSESQSQLGAGDYAVIVIYFAFVLVVGIWSGRRSKSDTVSGYFLASRNMNFLLVGASLFASNIGSGHFIGLAGSGAASGIGIAAFELNAIFIVMVLGWIFVPVYMASGVYTMPEYLRKRFGGQRIRIYLSVLALILYVFTKISADLFAGALFIQQAMGLEGEGGLYLAILILLAIAAIFTIGGGLSSVMWTDFIQTILMLIGAFILMGFSLAEVGGYHELIRKYFRSYPHENYTTYDTVVGSCAKIPDDAMHLFRSAVPGESDLPWTGVIFGLTISAVWYWCSDQVIVQRALASKNMTHAKAGCILAGYLKILPMFLLVLPGMAARVLYPDRVGCASPESCKAVCGSEAGCTNIAYIELVIKLMPQGLTGLMLAVMLAALMSSLTSIFNSASTIFTIDIWTRIRRSPSDTELLIVGRVFVLVLVAVSIIWIPIIQAARGSELFVYVQSITSYLAPPVCAIYVLAVFTSFVNEPGAFWGLMIGLALGLLRFGLEFGYTVPPCGSNMEDPRPEIIKRLVGDIHYLNFGCILFIIVIIASTVISLLTERIDKKYLYRLTFWSRHSTKVRLELEDNITEDKPKSSEANEPQANGHPTTDEEFEIELPAWRKVLNCLCGISTQNVNKAQPETDTPKLTPEEEAALAAEFLDEHPFWRNFVNVQAVIIMTVAAFIWGFFA